MNILLLNQIWGREFFEAAGHRVVTCGVSEHLDIGPEQPLFHIRSALSEVSPAFEPDIVLMHDDSAPLAIIGLEELECPKIFYSVDAHHHFESHAHLSALFDHVLIAQKDYTQEFVKRGRPAPEWMPLWASRFVEPCEQKEHGAVFVGTLNPQLNPRRVEFFDRLKERTEILCTSGAFWEIFPRSEVVINQTVCGDLNFRVFEAMMCGATLLTEMSGNGLTELFQPDQHLVTYEKGNVEDAAQKIESLLADRKRCREIAAAGREQVLKAHLPEHRAARFLELFNTVRRKSSGHERFGLMVNYHLLSVRLEKLDTLLSVKAAVEAMKMAELALQANEVVNDELAFFALRAALDFDRKMVSCSGANLLERLHERYPQFPLLRAAKLRRLLNEGKVNEAAEFARSISQKPLEETYEIAEKTIQIVLRTQLKET